MDEVEKEKWLNTATMKLRCIFKACSTNPALILLTKA
jgi:hypothetical protein